MSDTAILDISATCASNAIQSALEMRLGGTVKRCWTGTRNENDPQGRTEYDVPLHTAISKAPQKTRRYVEPKECSLFDDDEVLMNSRNARLKAGLA